MQLCSSLCSLALPLFQASTATYKEVSPEPLVPPLGKEGQWEQLDVSSIVGYFASVYTLKKQESSRKTSISALLTMPKPLTAWITINR